MKVNGCCFGCLETRHISRNCKKKSECGKDGCEASHHWLLHGAPRVYPKSVPFPGTAEDAGDMEPLPSDMPVQSKDEASFKGTTRQNNSVTLLPVVPMKVHGANGKTIEVYGLLDQESEVTLIDAQDAEKLQLKGKTRTSQFRTFHDDDSVLQVKEVAFTLKSLDESKLNLKKKNFDWSEVRQRWPHLENVKTPNTCADRVTVLIGMDNPAVDDIFEKRKTNTDYARLEAY